MSVAGSVAAVRIASSGVTKTTSYPGTISRPVRMRPRKGAQRTNVAEDAQHARQSHPDQHARAARADAREGDCGCKRVKENEPEQRIGDCVRAGEFPRQSG